MDRSKEFLNVLHKMKHFMHKVKCLQPIPQSEFMMLAMIEHSLEDHKENQPGVKVSDLAKRLDITNPAASKMLSFIEDKNYIERITDRLDRRVVYIILTENGKKILEDAKGEMELLTNRVMNLMGEEDSEAIVRLLNKLYLILEEEINMKEIAKQKITNQEKNNK